MSNKTEEKWIDAHVHIAQFLSGFGSRGEFYPIGNGRARWLTGEEKQVVPPGLGDDAFTYQDLIRLMDSYEIERAVILQGPMLGFHNEYVAEAMRAFPERLTGLGCYDPYCAEHTRILNRLTNEMCFPGLKFELSVDCGLGSMHDDIDLFEDRWTEIWERAEEKELILAFDFGTLGGPNSRLIAQTAELAASYAKATWVMEHAFLPYEGTEEWFKEETACVRDHENVVFTIATFPSFFKKGGFPYRGSWPFLQILKDTVGTKRILWGTDAPGTLMNTPYRGLKEYLKESGVFSEDELKDVVRNNALKIYWSEYKKG